MKNFKELGMWQKGMNIVVNCFETGKDFLQQEKFGLAIQVTRSGVSTASNIAEGRRRFSEKHYRHFAELSLGSSFELETQLLIAQKVDIGDRDIILKTLNDVSAEQKMLIGFINKLSRLKSDILFFRDLPVACSEKPGAHTRQIAAFTYLYPQIFLH